MPTVTAITRQRKRESRYSVQVDGKYAFSLPDLELSASNLRVGTELTEAEVGEWQQRAGEGKAYDQALRYIGLRRRSKAEIERYLTRKEYDEEVIRETTTRLMDMGLLDDAAFAAAWIRERQLLRPRSVQALRFELMKLGVARADIDAALEQDGPDEVQTIVELIERRSRQYPDRDKLMAYLGRQGFRYGQIKEAFARLDDI